jgi:hypothetical protein
MTTPAVFEFRWLSPLGASVVLFILFGLLLLFIGVVTPFAIMRPGYSQQDLLTSARADTLLFGRTPTELFKDDLALATLWRLMALHLGGMFAGFGIFQIVVAWLGLRHGQAWALWTLTAADLSILPYIALIMSKYTEAGAALGIGDMPPYFMALVIIPIALVLGWFGLR